MHGVCRWVEKYGGGDFFFSCVSIVWIFIFSVFWGFFFFAVCFFLWWQYVTHVINQLMLHHEMSVKMIANYRERERERDNEFLFWNFWGFLWFLFLIMPHAGLDTVTTISLEIHFPITEWYAILCTLSIITKFYHYCIKVSFNDDSCLSKNVIKYDVIFVLFPGYVILYPSALGQGQMSRSYCFYF